MLGTDESKATALELPAVQFMFYHGATPYRTLANATDNPRRARAIHYMDATARSLDGNREAEPPENMPIVRGASIG